MTSLPTIVLIILAAVIAVPLAIAALVYLIVPVCKGIVWLIAHIFGFIFGEIGDILRLLGAIIASIVLIPFTVFCVALGRWSGASHYGRALQGEGKAMGRCVYRMFVGRPAKLLGLSPLTEGLEKRIPEVVAAAPGPDMPRGGGGGGGKAGRAGQFEGYSILGSLPGGGSGGRLYVAQPTPEKIAQLARCNITNVDRVVIKSFSLNDGSSLPQIVRENRALPAAKRLCLILEHELTDGRFYYVMRYVPGDSLGLITQRLHAASGPGGLGPREIRSVMSYAADLLRTLTVYHGGGLWHKDVKPDNIIISSGSAQLVDFGLITPLRSSMTLTTHGTEYFRDPEMVRMALRGVKVHEVDGARFDIYAAGAVLYSMIENSFPAHGGLSQIGKPCPEALRWIVRRAMTDYDKRYASAADMLADLEVVARADDPASVKPFALPSMRNGIDAAHTPPPIPDHGWEGMPGNAHFAAAAASQHKHGVAIADALKKGNMAGALGGVGAAIDDALNSMRAATPTPPPAPQRPRLSVTDWWTGRYRVGPAFANVKVGAGWPKPPVNVVQPAAFIPAPPVPEAPRRTPRNPGSTAAEQLVSARARAHQARERARARMSGRTGDRRTPITGGTPGIAIALFVFLGACVLFVGGIVTTAMRSSESAMQVAVAPTPTARIDTAHTDVEARIHAVRVQVRQEAEGFKRMAESIRKGSIIAADALRDEGYLRSNCDALDGHPVFVLRDPVTFEAANKDKIDTRLDMLARAGFTLSGEAAPEAEAGDSAEEIAALRAELGLLPLGTKDAESAIRTWLDENPDYAMVVWLGRHTGNQPEAWVVGRNDGDADVLDDIARILSGNR